MSKLRTVIVEDEVNGQETLLLLLKDYCPQVEVIGVAGTLSEAENLLVREKPDLVFLDIQIGTQTIFELLNQIAPLNFEIIFTSAHENYAIKAIRFMAIDYLLKPIEIDLLTDAVSRAVTNATKRKTQVQLSSLMDNLQQRDLGQHRIALASTDSYELVLVSDILYCIAEGSYTRFFLKNNQELFVSRNLKYYENLLNDYPFFRPHQSCLINLYHITRVHRQDGGSIEMLDGKQLPIARNRKNELIESLKIR